MRRAFALLSVLVALGLAGCFDSSRLDRHFAWLGCLEKACDRECRSKKFLGGSMRSWDHVAKVVACQCYPRRDSVTENFTFGEMRCGPRPQDKD